MLSAKTKPSQAKLVDLPSGESLVDFYNRVRQESLNICKPLEVEDYNIQTMPDVSPPKWHLAHTSWFFETFLLKPHFPNYSVYHPRYEHIFNSYYEQIGTYHPRPQRGNLSRPTLNEIFSYRLHVDTQMNKLIADQTLNNTQSIVDKVVLGLNHEQQHQELLYTDILHIFASNPLLPQYRKLKQRQISKTIAKATEWVHFDESLSEFGFSDDGFYYDNELPKHKAYTTKFKIASKLVTNAEYLNFIIDGGYSTSTYWLSDAWTMIKKQGWQHPIYWSLENDVWFEMTLGGKRELDMNAPVSHVSYFESDAYANWSKSRLPTEYEWELAASSVQVSGNLRESDFCHPIVAENSLKLQLQQMYGDLWEWTKSPYVAYPGYRAVDGAIGEYNGKFMSNQIVLKGGSCVTPKEHIRSTYRNFFYPYDRWQFSGFRLAQDY
ncbi:hypothetical protein MNBD_GAMMA22-1846 [hydrothermal vent metagenome]|uniref:Ergothioneine biosynthesis protein EgtB n=1 Tax=hydrothermal vent metagenome TaxID=652676 RepID=A0A3B1ABS6_9ZZZZ